MAAPALVRAGELVERRLGELFDREAATWREVDPDLAEAVESLRRFTLGGGKRLRPAFSYWAFVGFTGPSEDPRVVDLCSALELIHAYALLHDDVMDGSEKRRGAPAVHAAYRDQHSVEGWRGDARRFGEGVAVLLGDLACSYAEVVSRSLPLEVAEHLDLLRTEVVMGQYLDLLSAVRGDLDPARARLILLLKSSRYTIERPLDLGATLAGASPAGRAALAAYGAPLGEAFQLRDDVLGVFGEESALGKPVGDDLREGKATPLLAAAYARVDADGRALLSRAGASDHADDEVAAMCHLIDGCGARAEIDGLVDALVIRATEVAAHLPVSDEAREAFGELAAYVARRTR